MGMEPFIPALRPKPQGCAGSALTVLVCVRGFLVFKKRLGRSFVFGHKMV